MSGEATDRQLAYIAGIVDVMAVLRIRNTQGAPLPFVEINCPNLALLEWLAERTGTSVTVVNRDYTRNGCALHCPEAHVHIRSASGRWSLSGVRATVVLHGVVPFMQLQTEAAQQLLEAGLRAPRKPATIAKMTNLGWAVPEFLPWTKKLSE